MISQQIWLIQYQNIIWKWPKFVWHSFWIVKVLVGSNNGTDSILMPRGALHIFCIHMCAAGKCAFSTKSSPWQGSNFTKFTLTRVHFSPIFPRFLPKYPSFHENPSRKPILFSRFSHIWSILSLLSLNLGALAKNTLTRVCFWSFWSKMI